MNGMMESITDDGSIVVVTNECFQDMDNEDDHFEHSYDFPGMVESQKLSDSTHKQLQDILKENNELRDSLHKNNTEMKQLLGAFRDYQDKTIQSRAMYKQRVDSIWKENKQLQEEKENLQTENQNLQTDLKSRDSSIEKLHEDLSAIQKDCTDYQSELAKVKEDLKRAELSALTVTSELKELEAEVTFLKLEKEKLGNQNEALMEQLDKQNAAFQEQLATAERRYTDSENEVLTLKENLEDHRLKILKLNDDIQNLSSQNDALLKELEVNSVADSLKNYELEKEVTSLQQNVLDKSASELEMKSRLEEAEQKLISLQNQIIILEEEKSKRLGQEINRTDDDDMGFSIINKQNLEAGPSALQKQLEEEKARTDDLKKTMVLQEEQLEKLQKELEEQKNRISIQEAESADHFFNAQNITRIKTPYALFQDYEEKYQSLGEQLGACNERLEYLRLEDDSRALVEGLQAEISELRQVLELEQSEKTNLQQRADELTAKYRQILASWEIYESDQLTKGRQNEALSAIEKRNFQEKMDELMAKNVQLEEENQAKDNELSNIKRQISFLSRDNEQMPILRAQVELYTQDFTRERDEKAKAIATSDLLKQELSSAHAQINELRDELNIHQQQQRQELSLHQEHLLEVPSSSTQQYTENQDDIVQPIEQFVMPHSDNTTVQPFRASDADEESGRRKGRGQRPHRRSSPHNDNYYGSGNSMRTFECPRCKMSYSSVTAVENHLEGCLREDGPYP